MIFHCYLQAAQHLVEGKSPYSGIEPFPYIYPVFLAFILIPFLYIPYSLAVLLWFCLNIGAGFYTIRILAGTMPAAKDKNLFFSICLAVFWLLLPPVQSDLLNGQINMAVLLLCTLFFMLLQKKSVCAASLCLAAGIAIKIYPAIFLFFLLVRKEWKGFFLTLLYAFVFSLAPILLLGNQIFHIYGDYLQNFVFHQFKANASVLSHSREFSLYGILVSYCPALNQIEHFKLICAGVGIALVSGIGFLFKKQCEELVLSFYLICILLMQPISEAHHLVLLIPAVSCLIANILDKKNMHFVFHAGFLAVFLLLFNLERLNISGPFYFLAAVCLFVYTGWAMFRERPRLFPALH